MLKLRLFSLLSLVFLLCACSEAEEGTEKTIFVGPLNLSCEGAGTTCLQVRDSLTGPIAIYTGEIEGLQAENGQLYQLKVMEVADESSPSGYSYTLLENLGQEAFPVWANPRTNTELENVGWHLQAMQKEGQWIGLRGGSGIVAQFFSGKGQVSGSSGCNTYFATYELSGNSLTMGPSGSTRKMCNNAPGIMDQEFDYLSLLNQATSFTIIKGQLLIECNGGGKLLYQGL